MLKYDILTSQLSYIFKTFDIEQKGKLDNSDISRILTKLLGLTPSNDDIAFITSHLRSKTNSNIHDLNLSTFISAVKSDLLSKPIRTLLNGVFYGLSDGKDILTVNTLLETAKKASVHISPESEYRLFAIFPNGYATFDMFVEAIEQSI